MVGSMNDIAASAACRRRLFAALALLGAMPASTALAGELPDPTRPPATQRASAGAGVAPAPTPATLVLQSVLIGDGRKPSAIISGRMVTLGDSFDAMRLTRVTETGAVLSGPHGPTALALTPNSDKQLAAAPPAERLAAATPAASGRRLGPASIFVRVAEQK